MELALRVSRRGLGQTAPNPSVGAIIADERTGEVIARGWTQPGGRPHAEVDALARAGRRAKGQTLYVTLEPCSHHGRTPPCADAIVAAGLARVVVGIEDPDPRVSGRGLERLRCAGVSVTRGVLAKQAHAILRGHIVRVTERRPFVQIKMALNAAGEVARGKKGSPVWVTGPLARRMGHMLRARCDAILVGAGTLRDDNPGLDCRLPGLAHRSPLPVVLTGERALPAQARLFWNRPAVPSGAETRPAGMRALIAAPETRASAVTAMLNHVAEAQGHPPSVSTPGPSVEVGAPADVVALKTVGSRIWLPGLSEELVSRGITRLLVEGGPAVWSQMLAARLADEVVVFRALGDASPDTAAERTIDELHRRHVGLNFAIADRRRIDDDVMIVLRPERAETGES